MSSLQNPVSWQSYQGISDVGGVAGLNSQATVDDLNKALVAGTSQYGTGQPGDGFAIRVQSLESTLKNTTFKMEHIALWKAIPKLPAYNTVEEHNEISAYGSNTDGGFFTEGGLPSGDDSTYTRRYAIVKFLGTLRRVTHPMTLVKPAHGDIIAQETVAGTMDLLRKMERALFYGDSSLSALQFDGYEKMINDRSPATNIKDMRGLPLSEDSLTDGATTVQDAPNYGTPTHLFANNKVIADFTKTFFPKERVSLPQAGNGMVGLNIQGFTSTAGNIAFQPDVFISDGGTFNAAPVGVASDRPAEPTVSTALATSTDANTQFGVGDAGSYFFTVVACNDSGRSAPITVNTSATAIAAGQKFTFGVTPSLSQGVTGWFEVYRSVTNGAASTQKSIARVPANGSSPVTISDLNAKIPGTTTAFLFQMNLEAMSFKQLAPMVKMPLGVIDTSIRWLQLIYGTPVLYTPGKMLMFKNVGRAYGSI